MSEFDDYIERAGLCRRCHRKIRAKGYVNCPDCIDYMRMVRANVRDHWRAAGLCPECGGPITPGAAMCDRCRIRKRVYKDHMVSRRRAAGLCIICGKRSVKGTGYLSCIICREKQRARDKYEKLRRSSKSTADKQR